MENKKICRNCGAEVDGTAAFCQNCASSEFIQPEQPPYAAPPQGGAPAPKKSDPKMLVIVLLAIVIVVGGVLATLFFTGVIGGEKKSDGVEDVSDDDEDSDKKDSEDKKDKEEEKPDMAEAVIGTWKAEMKFADLLDATVSSGTEIDDATLDLLNRVDSDAAILFHIGIEEDNTFQGWLVEDEIEQFAEQFKEECIVYFRGNKSYVAELNGITEAQLDSALNQQNMTYDELVDQMADQMDVSSMATGITSNTTEKDGKLFLMNDGEDLTYEIKADQIHLKGSGDESYPVFSMKDEDTLKLDYVAKTENDDDTDSTNALFTFLDTLTREK